MRKILSTSKFDRINPFLLKTFNLFKLRTKITNIYLSLNFNRKGKLSPYIIVFVPLHGK